MRSRVRFDSCRPLGVGVGGATGSWVRAGRKTIRSLRLAAAAVEQVGSGGGSCDGDGDDDEDEALPRGCSLSPHLAGRRTTDAVPGRGQSRSRATRWLASASRRGPSERLSRRHDVVQKVSVERRLTTRG